MLFSVTVAIAATLKSQQSVRMNYGTVNTKCRPANAYIPVTDGFFADRPAGPPAQVWVAVAVIANPPVGPAAQRSVPSGPGRA